MPLFLYADPQNTGNSPQSRTCLRMEALIFVDGQFLAVEVFFHQFIAAFSSNFADLVAEFLA